MHELGVLRKILECVRTAAEANRVRRVRAVELEIGEASGVLPEFIERCYRPAVENDPLFEGSELIVTSIPTEARCAECGSSRRISGLDLTCPECGAAMRVVRGRELAVRNILVET